jgi:TMEM199 family protein
MVLLTMTPAIVRTITEAQKVAKDDLTDLCLPNEPSLAEPKVGEPISHGQLVDLSKLLKKHIDKIQNEDEKEPTLYSLNDLLKGSSIYIPSPPPKREPVSNLDTGYPRSLLTDADIRV